MQPVKQPWFALGVTAIVMAILVAIFVGKGNEREGVWDGASAAGAPMEEVQGMDQGSPDPIVYCTELIQKGQWSEARKMALNTFNVNKDPVVKRDAADLLWGLDNKAGQYEKAAAWGYVALKLGGDLDGVRSERINEAEQGFLRESSSKGEFLEKREWAVKAANTFLKTGEGF